MSRVQVSKGGELPQVNFELGSIFAEVEFGCRFRASLHLVQKTETDAFLKDRAKWAVDYVGREVIVWVPLGFLIFAVSVSLGTAPLVALLACGGVLAILMLRRLSGEDRPIDDPARIAATRPQVMQNAERWAKGTFRGLAVGLGYAFGEVILWIIVGVIWGLFVLLRKLI